MASGAAAHSRTNGSAMPGGSSTVSPGTSSEEEFFDAPSSLAGSSSVVLPRTYARVRDPHDVEKAPDSELSLIRLAREVLGSVKAGADVTNVNLPASILDPVSTLEKTTKSMQRGDLIPDICSAKTAEERMLAVLRFNLSGLAKEKFGKKPYNPVLGELFRCAFVHRDVAHGQTVLVAEQVSHHPPITALHLSNRTLGFHMNSYTAPEPRFWGNSLEVKLSGCIRITLDCLGGEEYLLTRPVLNMTGFLAGKQRLEFSGPAEIVCERTGLGAHLEYKARGMMGRGELHAISGRVFETRTDETLYTFEGLWDNVVRITDMRTKETRVLYEYNEVKASKSMLPVLPCEADLEPSFSTLVWAECSEAIWRANTADANAAKRRVEDAQREKKKKRIAENRTWSYNYFRKRADGDDGYTLREDLKHLVEPKLPLPPDTLAAVRAARFDEVEEEFREVVLGSPSEANGGGPSKSKKGKIRRRLAIGRNRKNAAGQA